MQQQSSVPSPCVSICALDDNDVCTGCFRSADEILRWRMMTDDEKRAVYKNIEVRTAKAGTWMTGGQ